MTVDQMLIGVQLGVQKLDSNAYGNIITEEALYYLNKANREYIRRQTIYLKENMERASRQDYIADNEASNNLRTLIVEQDYVTGQAAQGELELSANTVYTNVKEADLSTLNFYNYVYATAFGEVARECKLVSHSEVHLYVKNDYNNPVYRRMPILIAGDKLQVFYDGEAASVDDLRLVYIKTPTELASGGTPELPPHTHDDIVDLAVAMIMEDIKSARPYEQNQQTLKGEQE